MEKRKRNVGFVIGLMISIAILSGCASALQEAAQRGDVQAVRTLLDQGADKDKNDVAYAFVQAALNGHLQVVELFLQRGVDPNVPYTFAAKRFYPLEEAAYGGNIKIVRLLLDHGAQIDSMNGPFNFTALTQAAARGHTEIVRLLLERGADVTIPDAWGTSILWWAVRDAGKAEIVEMLLAHGADPGIKGREIDIMKRWRTPLEVAQEKGNTRIVRLLQQAEARLSGVASAPPAVVAAPAEPPVLTVPASDVDTLPSRRVKTNANAYAIVIGIEQYRQKLPRADYATNDAKIVSQYLTNVMGYPEENVITLLNDRALKSDMEKYFDRWLSNNVDKDGKVFIYYSGHGAPNTKTGDAYLVPYDGDPTFIAETGYPIARLYESLGKLRATEITVILDSCFSGAGGRSVLAKGAKPLVITINTPNIRKNIAVMTASSGDQISSAYEEKGHGLFTYFLLKGIKNEEVLKKDGSINMDDLFGYIKPQVERIARKQYNNEQSPQLIEAKKN
jgi:ankyrin repeat protein